MSRPNPAEVALIAEIEHAIENYKKPNRDDAVDFCFVPEAVSAFQDLALKVAVIISDQGVENTCGQILAVAAEIKKLDDIEWNHAGSIGRAFEHGITTDIVMSDKKNPLVNAKLPPVRSFEP